MAGFEYFPPNELFQHNISRKEPGFFPGLDFRLEYYKVLPLQLPLTSLVRLPLAENLDAAWLCKGHYFWLFLESVLPNLPHQCHYGIWAAPSNSLKYSTLCFQIIHSRLIFKSDFSVESLDLAPSPSFISFGFFSLLGWFGLVFFFPLLF